MACPLSLSPHTISFVLQYIAPPSTIARPLPRHLLSRALLQRHHFLGISFDDAQEYLCWPSSSDVRARAIALLEDLPRVDPEDAMYTVQYTSDAESTYAHAHVPSVVPSDGSEDLRLVFHWDGDEWKYHDATLMPFPPTSHPDIESPPAVSLLVPQHLYLSAETSEAQGGAEPAQIHASDDDDDYWNSYGVQDDDEDQPKLQRVYNVASAADTNQSKEEAAEAAYWAQYSSVHGTADSTIPSPLPAHRRQVLQSQILPPGSGDTEEPQMVYFPRRDCPSPVTLSNLLRNASRRHSYSEPYSFPTSSPPENNSSSGAVLILNGADADGDSSDGSSEDTKVLSPKVETPAGDKQGLNLKSSIINGEVGRDDTIDAALKVGVTGLYRLWKASKAAGAAEEQDRKEEFMRVVRDVVMGLP
ncbi:hypothetical protein NEOLEDRAFT_1165905 [Neolentinus lepideus HHB14362 ss-1]|uniref:Uncharacterized protein n=1 Tax=Neolentinus lepideus HHB14362 ss-1 TaxID=1314782 RepID=A0A165VYX5_9AGAM|nr:hypothetical protein NEOLEDRAFT_1165905 [Neolentinus lepideus HHB14362 ss-1]